MKNDFEHKINCLTFSIGERFQLSISDVGRGSNAFKEALIWDADKDGFLDDFNEGCLSVNALHEVIQQAVKHCNNVLMNEMIEEGDDRFITLD